jgi:hypothetical protein
MLPSFVVRSEYLYGVLSLNSRSVDLHWKVALSVLCHVTCRVSISTLDTYAQVADDARHHLYHESVVYAMQKRTALRYSIISGEWGSVGLSG